MLRSTVKPCLRALALGARLAPLFYRGDFLGKSVMTHVIEFARRSGTFMAPLQDLVEGSQGYTGLAARLYRALGTSLVERLAGALVDYVRCEIRAVIPVAIWEWPRQFPP